MASDSPAMANMARILRDIEHHMKTQNRVLQAINHNLTAIAGHLAKDEVSDADNQSES